MSDIIISRNGPNGGYVVSERGSGSRYGFIRREGSRWRAADTLSRCRSFGSRRAAVEWLCSLGTEGEQAKASRAR